MGLPSRNKGAGGLGGEEVDSYSDLRLARRWKRRGIIYGNLGINASRDEALKKSVLRDNGNNDVLVEVVTIDSDDEQLLDGLQLSVDFDRNDDSDVFDPQYKMFLDNLKEDGESYLLELALVNETSVVVKYEKEDGSTSLVDVDKLETVMCHQKQGKIRTGDALKYEKEDGSTSLVDVDKLETVIDVDKLETVMCHQKQGKIRTGDALKRLSKRKKIEPLRLTLRSHSGRENTENSESVLRNSLRRERSKSPRMVLSSNSQRKNNENPRTMNDVVKKVKTAIPRILRSNSRSETYKSSRNGDGCSSKRHSSKAANAARHQGNHGVVSKASNSSNHQSNHVAKSHFAEESYLEFLKSVKNGRHMEWTPEGGKRIIYEECDYDSEAGAGQEAEDPVSFEYGSSSKSQNPEATNSAKHQCNDGVMSDLADENYQDFLKFVKNDRRLEYNPVGGEKVAYDESDSDSEVMILDNNLFSDGKPTPVVFVDLDGEECIENHIKESAFRVELMEILRRPYDVLEYEKLWQNASYKSPLQGVRVLRKRDISYPLPYHCRSYLDVYSDLASMINHSQPDKLRILNLLRGFLYWLQNVAREGSFKPWLDSSCLSVLPPVPLTASTSG